MSALNACVCGCYTGLPALHWTAPKQPERPAVIEPLYRRALTADVAAMDDLRAASGWEGAAPAETMRRYLAGEHHPQHALMPRMAFVAEADGALVGFIAGHLTTRFGCEGELQWLLVVPAWRGSTAASGLLAALAAWFGTECAGRVCVNVAPENARARRFYARFGAVPLSRYWMVWPDIRQVAALTGAAGRHAGASDPAV